MADDGGLNLGFSEEDLTFSGGNLFDLDEGLTADQFRELAAEIGGPVSHNDQLDLNQLSRGVSLPLLPQSTGIANTPPILSSSLPPAVSLPTYLDNSQPPIRQHLTRQHSHEQQQQPQQQQQQPVKQESGENLDAIQVAASQISRLYNHMLMQLPAIVRQRTQHHLLMRTSEVCASGMPLVQATMLVQQELLPLMQKAFTQLKDSLVTRQLALGTANAAVVLGGAVPVPPAVPPAIPGGTALGNTPGAPGTGGGGSVIQGGKMPAGMLLLLQQQQQQQQQTQMQIQQQQQQQQQQQVQLLRGGALLPTAPFSGTPVPPAAAATSSMAANPPRIIINHQQHTPQPPPQGQPPQAIAQVKPGALNTAAVGGTPPPAPLPSIAGHKSTPRGGIQLPQMIPQRGVVHKSSVVVNPPATQQEKEKETLNIMDDKTTAAITGAALARGKVVTAKVQAREATERYAWTSGIFGELMQGKKVDESGLLAQELGGGIVNAAGGAAGGSDVNSSGVVNGLSGKKRDASFCSVEGESEPEVLFGTEGQKLLAAAAKRMRSVEEAGTGNADEDNEGVLGKRESGSNVLLNTAFAVTEVELNELFDSEALLNEGPPPHQF